MFTDFEWKQSGHLSKEFQRSCSEWILRAQGKVLRSFLGKKHLTFYQFQILSKKYSNTRQNFPAGLSKLSLTSPEECFEVFLRKNTHFINFALWAKKWIDYWRKARGRIVKLLRLRRNILERTFFRKINFFYFALSTVSETFWDFSQKHFSRFVRTAVYVYRGAFRYCFLAEGFLLMIFRLHLQKQNIIQLLTGKLWQACQKCKLGVQGMNSRANILWRRIKFFIIFVFWVKTIRTSGEKILAGLSKLQFTTSTEERFNIVSRKKFLFIYFGLYLRKNYSTFAGNISGELVENANWLSKGSICGKMFFEEV